MVGEKKIVDMLNGTKTTCSRQLVKRELPEQHIDQPKGTSSKPTTATVNTNYADTTKPLEANEICQASQEQEQEQRDLIKEICPLIKHNKLLRHHQTKPVHQELVVALAAELKSPVAAAAQASLMAEAAMRVIKINGVKSRPLRQINIVGQLNHSASKGFLLMMNLILLPVLLLTITGSSLVPLHSAVEAAIWPFGAKHTAASGKHHHLWPLVGHSGARDAQSQTETSSGIFKRVARSSNHQQPQQTGGGDSQTTAASPGPVPPPLTQQFHYFWNHDQLEPKHMASAANKILAEAQEQTNQVSAGPNSAQARTIAAGSSEVDKLSVRSMDPMQSSASSVNSAHRTPSASSEQSPPVVVPPSVQQQLTAMVLQMQRQQQASMMMQPRFDSSPAQRRFSNQGAMSAPAAASVPTPINPFGQFWMPPSAPNPMMAGVPQVQMSPPMGHGPMMAAESMQMATAAVAPMSPFAHMAPGFMNQPRAPTAATIAGVPVFGPFVVSPSMPGAHFSMPMQHPRSSNHHSHSSKSSSSAAQDKNDKSARGGSSLLSRRKSWPFSLGDRMSIFASASQPRVTILPAPTQMSPVAQQQASQQQQQQQHQLLVASLSQLLPESILSGVDMASSQLMNSIANQMKVTLDQQRVALALAKMFEQQHLQQQQQQQQQRQQQLAHSADNQGSASNPSAQFASPIRSEPSSSQIPSFNMQLVNRRPLNLQAPYLIPNLVGPQQQQQLQSNEPSITDSFLGYAQQPAQSFDLSAGLLTNTSVPYGSRLKRRHLSNGPNKQAALRMGNWSQTDSMPIIINESSEGIWSNGPVLGIPTGAQESVTLPVQSANSVQSSTLKRARSVEQTVGSSSSGTSAVQADASRQRVGRSANLNPTANSSKRIVPKNILPEGATIDTQDRLASEQATRSEEESLRELFLQLAAVESSLSMSPDQGSLLTGLVEGISPDSLILNDDSQEHQTQLRRLKRSADGGQADEVRAKRVSREVSGSSGAQAFQASGWKSIPEAKQSANKTMKFPEKVSVFQWTKIERLGVSAGAEKPLQVTEKSPQSPVTSSGPLKSSGKDEVASSADKRQDRSLKVKRITASASVLHHPVSRLQSDVSVKRGVVFAGVPTSLIPSVTASAALIPPKPTSQSAVTESTSSAQSISVDSSSISGDPMQASVAESARVVNYFQNVDNERSSSVSSSSANNHQASAPQISTSSSSSVSSPPGLTQSSAPAVNVGFSAPEKWSTGSVISSQQPMVASASNYQLNEQNGLATDIRRKQAGARSGDGITSMGQSSDYSNEQATSSGSSSSGGVQRQPMYQQPLAAANNADISSSATRNLAYSVNNMQSMSNNQMVPMQSSYANTMPGQLATGTVQTGSSNHARVGSIAGSSSINNNNNNNNNRQQQQQQMAPSAHEPLSKLMNAYFGTTSTTPGSKVQSGDGLSVTMVPIFGATSLSRQSIVSPSGKLQPSASSYESQTTSSSVSDLGSYNDMDIPSSPQQQQQQQQQQHSSSSSGSSYVSDSGNQQIGQQMQQQQDGITSMPNFASAGDHSSGDMQNSGNSNSGNSLSGYTTDTSFNAKSPSDTFGDLPIDQAIELSRFNQQQQQQSQPQQQQQQMSSSMQSQQGDTPVFESPETVSLMQQVPNDMGAGSFGTHLPSYNPQPQQHQQQQQQQQNQISQMTSDEAQLLAAQSSQPVSPQERFYTQQMQALGAAVSNYNQQRFNQLQADAAMRQQFSSQPSRAVYHQPAAGSHQQYAHAISVGQQAVPGQGQMWSDVDEDAAAGTAAAAGIPSYPSAAQLMAMQSHGTQLGDLNGMMTAGTESRREANGNEESGKKIKKKNLKHVSNHYHFNNFGSPFEDPESQYSPLASLELAGPPDSYPGLGHQGSNKNRPKANKEEEKKQEEEEAQPKKKGFLRRFSIKNLFKRFRKDKKKGNEGANEEQSSNNGESNSER